MRHNHFSLNGFFGLIGKEPASVARDLTAFSWQETCNPAEHTSQNPGSKTIREFRKPVFVINEWLQLVHFSSFKTAPENPN